MARERLNEEEKNKIVESIRAAEKNTSGEIRVHIDSRCSIDPLEKATALFYDLKMDKTKLKNAVLFYLAIDDHKFAIVGDKGINDATPKDFWIDIKESMKELLIRGNLIGAIEKGVLMAGEALGKYFPYEKDDKNELSDDISFGE